MHRDIGSNDDDDEDMDYLDGPFAFGLLMKEWEINARIYTMLSDLREGKSPNTPSHRRYLARQIRRGRHIIRMRRAIAQRMGINPDRLDELLGREPPKG